MSKCASCAASWPKHNPGCSRRKSRAHEPELPPVPPWPDNPEDFRHMLELALQIEAGWEADERARRKDAKR